MHPLSTHTRRYAHQNLAESLDFGEIEFTDIETTVEKAIDYYQKYGTLGEYSHLRVK